MTVTLDGRRVLVVEDEPLIAMMIVDILETAGCDVVGPAYDETQALECISGHKIDAAILDFNLGRDRTSSGIATKLVELEIPFLFATGYGEQALRNANWSQPTVAKPYHAPDVISAIADLVDDSGEKRRSA